MNERRERIRQTLLCAFWMAAAAQVNLNLFGSDFRISVACVLLTAYAMVLGEYPAAAVSVASAGVSLLFRVVWVWLRTGVFSAASFWPEIAFYLLYGVLTELWLRRLHFRITSWTELLVLLPIDFASNLLELFCRGGTLLSARIVWSLLAVAGLRTLLLCVIRTALERQKFYLLRREHVQRYERLVLLISRMRGEAVWMRKNAAAVENTMCTAYSLYTRLQATDEGAAQEALNIAKDVHEIKKEYQLITRGIDQALSEEVDEDAMAFQELWRVLWDDLQLTARHAGVQVEWAVDAALDFRTRQQYALLSILRNLLDNAVEAAVDGRVHIAFTARREGEDDVFIVASRGRPIPPEDLKALFEPGFSTKIDYSTGQVGRGVGLCLVKDLAERELSGSVNAACRDGEAVFTVRIPKKQLEE